MQHPLLDESSMILAQKLAAKSKIVYTMKKDVYPIVGSRRTAYRRLSILEALGIVRRKRGNFLMNRILSSQSMAIVHKIIPSLLALKRSKRFGMHYNDHDIRLAGNLISDAFVTLDYKAWKLTKFQPPKDFCIYVNNIDAAVTNLKYHGFSEGQKGNVIVLPTIGNFDNEIERVYLDCIARGGRSIQDAIAIEILYKKELTTKANFPVESILKVHQDLPKSK